MNKQETKASPPTPLVKIPPYTWNRPIGLGWENPYTVRYKSNIDDGPWHGMPLGGFGAGCIGRSPRGEFNLWHIDGGEHVFKTVPACQFSIFENDGETKLAYALSTETPEDGTLEAWQWYPPSKKETESQINTGIYHALYPRSWFVYENVLKAEVSCEQFSPIWEKNYQETSYPVGVFLWSAKNPTDKPITLSIMLTWQNMVGWFTNSLKSPEVKLRDDGSPVYEYKPRWGESADNYNQLVETDDAIGSVLGRVDGGQLPGEGDGQWCFAVPKNSRLEVFYNTHWNPQGSGEELWKNFSDDGSLVNASDNQTPAIPGQQLAAAIAVRFTLQPQETLEIPFALSWDFPVTEFAEGIIYFRRYTDFYNRTGKNAWAIASDALTQYQTWQEKITTWQQPILNRIDFPDWFKMALFNELYDLTAGGTLWSAATQADPYGQFAVLECLDYRWYESLDVRLYGSFGLLILFPELEKAVMTAFSRAIPSYDEKTRVIGYYYTIGAESPLAPRKLPGATPHDLGAPNEHVWEKTNYTSYQDCNQWKDLACDFVLQLHRDFIYTGSTNLDFLKEHWNSMVQTINYVKGFDIDGDGIPENSGAPDQTFDDWRLQGVSAYCGGLWLATLAAAIDICKFLLMHSSYELNPQEILAQRIIYEDWYRQSSIIYQEKLWNGKYYRLDSNSGSNVVMADQLCGQFYVSALNLPDIVPKECAQMALKTVYETCFLKFYDGQFGAANGLLPDGSPENPKATHPLEVWTGINFGLAAFMMQIGMKDEGWRITEAVVKQIYDNGLQFRTPEAITAAGTFRASTYLRAMAIWAVYFVLTSYSPSQDSWLSHTEKKDKEEI
jgi:non-lysosomal glucosylceramidase